MKVEVEFGHKSYQHTQHNKIVIGCNIFLKGKPITDIHNDFKLVEKCNDGFDEKVLSGEIELNEGDEILFRPYKIDQYGYYTENPQFFTVNDSKVELKGFSFKKECFGFMETV